MIDAKTMAIEEHAKFFKDGADVKARGYAAPLLSRLVGYYEEDSVEKARVVAALTGPPAISRLVTMWQKEAGWGKPLILIISCAFLSSPCFIRSFHKTGLIID